MRRQEGEKEEEGAGAGAGIIGPSACLARRGSTHLSLPSYEAKMFTAILRIPVAAAAFLPPSGTGNAPLSAALGFRPFPFSARKFSPSELGLGIPDTRRDASIPRESRNARVCDSAREQSADLYRDSSPRFLARLRNRRCRVSCTAIARTCDQRIILTQVGRPERRAVTAVIADSPYQMNAIWNHSAAKVLKHF